MPNRPDQHVVGDQAALDVRRFFVELGYAVESVGQDYGEDLVVQGMLHGRVEAFRVLIQVKGTRELKRRVRSNDVALSVSTAHLRKWCASDDLVVLVVWDVTAKTGFWLCPRLELDPVDLFAHGDEGNSQVVFPEDSTFDLPAAERIIWMARFDHLRRRLTELLQLKSLTSEEWLWPRVAVLMTEFLEAIDVIVPDYEIGPYVPRLWRDMMNTDIVQADDREARESRMELGLGAGNSEEDRLRNAACMVILIHSEGASDGVTPGALLVHNAASVLLTLLKPESPAMRNYVEPRS